MKAEKVRADFRKALHELEDALSSKPSSRLEQAGCIQYFEFCFELAWKAVKVFAEQQGMNELASPRGCLKTAFALDWIDDERLWLEMLEARNRMSHTDDSDTALAIFTRLADWLGAMRRLESRLESVS